MGIDNTMEQEFKLLMPKFLLEITQNVATISEHIKNYDEDKKEDRNQLKELQKISVEHSNRLERHSVTLYNLNKILFAILLVTVVALVGLIFSGNLEPVIRGAIQ